MFMYKYTSFWWSYSNYHNVFASNIFLLFLIQEGLLFPFISLFFFSYSLL